MFDTTIVITSEGTKLGVNASHYTLLSNGKQIGRIPPSMIAQIIVHHDVAVTRAAMERMAQSGVPLTFLRKDGRVAARLSPPWKHDAAPRLAQAASHLDANRRIALAKRFVDAKLANSAAVLIRFSSNHPDKEINRAAADIRNLRQSLAGVDSIEQLMGYEGMASRYYYSVFSKMIRAPWAEFTTRNRRPPKDPVNALLSYSYAVLTHQMHALAEGAGLDPYIGYLHSPEARRPTLALDLMEPFRPLLADRLCLRLLNLGTIREEHFSSEGESVFINLDGRKAIIRETNDWINQCDQDLADQGSSLQSSPQGLITRTIDRFAKHARTNTLDDFIPTYLLTQDQPHA